MKNSKRLCLVLALVIVSMLIFSVLVSCTAKVEYKLDFIVDGKVYHTVNTAGETTIAMPENPIKDGYTFAGWYNGTSKYIDGVWDTASNLTLTAKWDVITYTIAYNLNGGNASENPTTYTIESDNITLNNPTKTGYTFLGWSGTDLNGQTQNVVINAGSYGNRSYVANWKANSYTITYNPDGGTISSTTQEVTYADEYALLTPTREGYAFLGWYNGTTEYTSGIWQTAGNITLTAKWLDNNFNPKFDENYNLISFTYGEYPQTIKAYGVTITSTEPESNGYYLGSDEEYYAKVIANPYNSWYKFSNGTTITSGTEYYFKVEPIKWKVLYNVDGTYTVISDLILDSQCYYNSYESRNGATDYQGNSTTETVYENNYKYSDIRTFLNTTFLNRAFTSEEQIKIQTTEVDNSVSSTGYDSNSYACENTEDKIFLLSRKEATNVDYGFNNNASRYAKGTDYAKARGLYVYTSSGSNYTGNSSWWLRSPLSNSDNYAHYVCYDGNFGSGYVGTVYIDDRGVRPALKINL